MVCPTFAGIARPTSTRGFFIQKSDDRDGRQVMRVGRFAKRRKSRKRRGPITLKSRREIELMRDAGRLVADAHELVHSLVAPGVTTRQIDAAVARLFSKHGAEPLFFGVPCPTKNKKKKRVGPPFPAVTCMSVNEAVVHGIPDDRPLEEGDILSVDTGARLRGWCGDSAWTYAVGKVSPARQALLDSGKEILELAVIEFGRQTRWSQVGYLMEDFADRRNYGVVRDFVGHAIGREMHEDPQVPNFVPEDDDDDFLLQPGLVLAIEPMLNGGGDDVRVLKDGWTVVTCDGRPSVHFEHTVALTADGPEVLTAGAHNTLTLG